MKRNFYRMSGASLLVALLLSLGGQSLAAQGTITLKNDKGYAKNPILTIVAEGPVTIEGATGTFKNGEPVTYTMKTGENLVIKGDILSIESKNNSFSGIELKGLNKIKKISMEQNYFDSADFSECPELDSLFYYRNMSSTITLPATKKISFLNVSYNKLTALDLSNFSRLKEIYCYYNQLNELKLYPQDIIEVISCFNNNLTALDVKGRTKLRSLNVKSNKIAKMDVSGCTELGGLSVSSNNMSELVLGNNPKIVRIEAENNQLTSIPLKEVPNLKQLWMINNLLESIDLSLVPKLEKLSLGGNRLTTIDFRPAPLLDEVFVLENQLESVDVTMLPKLLALHVGSNKIKGLDLSKNPLLESLFASNNQISELDFDANPLLRDLEIDGNQIKGAAMSRMIQSLHPRKNKAGKFETYYIIVQTKDKPDQNEINTRQVQMFKDKYWDPRCMQSDMPKPVKPTEVLPNTYLLEIAYNREGGKIEVADKNIDQSQVPAQSKVAIKVTPKEGFKLDKLTAESIDDKGILLGDEKNITTTLEVEVTTNTHVQGKFVDVTSIDAPDAAIASVYPNPAQDRLVIGAEPQELIEVFAINGTKVYSAVAQEKGFVEIDITAWQEGHYIVKVGAQTARVVVSR